MKCQVCHQREATVAYTQIVENEKRTVFLCGICVSQHKNVMPHTPAGAAAGPVAVGKKAEVAFESPGPVEGTSVLRCPQCGTTYETFRKRGLFGCHACYEAFDQRLERLMKRIHGAVRHCGKGLVERREIALPEEELNRLRRELEGAVAAEAYERAAELRDRIREIEKSLCAEIQGLTGSDEPE